MEAPNNMNALASLIEDVILEILHHLPTHSLFCCKYVCRSWNSLIFNNRKVLPQTVASDGPMACQVIQLGSFSFNAKQNVMKLEI
jgi:hypothetical protein